MNKEERAAYNKQYLQDHKEEHTARNRKHYQAHKEKVIAKSKKYALKHKAEKATYDKKYRQENSEKIKKCYQTPEAKMARRKYNHKRKSQKMNAEYENFDPGEIFDRDGYRCQFCNKKTRLDFNRYHPLYPNLDHIVSLSKGGTHTRRNTQCLCRQCNYIKHNNDIGAQLRLFG